MKHDRDAVMAEILAKAVKAVDETSAMMEGVDGAEIFVIACANKDKSAMLVDCVMSGRPGALLAGLSAAIARVIVDNGLPMIICDELVEDVRRGVEILQDQIGEEDDDE